MIQEIIAAIGLFVGLFYTVTNFAELYASKTVDLVRVTAQVLGFAVFISAMWIF